MLKFIVDYWDNLIDVLLVAVGLSAYVVYYVQKREKLYSAGTLVIEQITLIEKGISSLKENHQLGNIAVYHSKAIIKDNMWEKYKHLFVKCLTGAEYESVQHFFDHAEQLERARQDIVGTIANGWRDKSYAEHQLVAEMIHAGVPDEEIVVFCNKYRPLDLVFTPDIAIKSLTKSLDTFAALTGTTSFAKIQKRSYSK